MKKVYLLIFLILFSLSIMAQAIEAPINGVGTNIDPYVIINISNLAWIQADNSLWDKHFILGNDIVITELDDIEQWYNGQGWIPIGNEETPFSGSFDGQNHIIYNLYINRQDLEGVGLFGWLSGDNCVIKNLGVIGANITGFKAVGGLVGVNDNYSTLENCYSRGVINGGTDNNIGGLAGKNNDFAEVNSCYSACHVYNQGSNVGGLIGLNDDNAIVTNSYALGNVSGGERVGGLVGRNRNDSFIEKCFSIGKVIGSTEEYINGLVGRNQAEAINSFWDIESSNCTAESAGEGKTTDEMKDILTFSEAGWSFEDFWGIDVNHNSGYPYLLWQNSASLPDPPELVILSPVIFSHEGGFYSNSFDLSLTHVDSLTTIIYTLDGSEPDINNLSGTTYQYKNSYPQIGTTPGVFYTNSFTSQIYTSPLNIFNRSSQLDKLTQISATFHNYNMFAPSTPVKKGMVIKAKAYKDGSDPSETTIHSYYVFNSDTNPYTLPLISLSLPEDEFFDYYKGIYVAGVDFDTWRAENPEGYPNAGVPANYHRRGSETEKVAHLEYFNPNATHENFSQNVGIRIHGGWSRARQIKSLRLYARSEYGKSTFDYQFFPDLEDDSFKRLLLRNAGNDYYQFYLRDPIMQKIVEDLNFDTQAYLPVIVYINGEYWGIHNLRERYDNDYLTRVYGVDGDNIDLLENNAEPDEGDSDNYNDLINFLENQETITQTDYEYLQTRLDIENFTDYQIAEIFSGNPDWPSNNVKFWRLKTDSYIADAPKGHDGRWRWLFYDLDLGLGLSGTDNPIEDNTLERVTTTNGINEWSTIILRKLLTNNDYKEKFINQFCDYLNTTFMFNRTSNTLDTYQMGIIDEIDEHIERFSRPVDYETWNRNYTVISDFLQERPGYLFQHLQNRFDLDSLRTISLNLNSEEAGYLTINSLQLDCENSEHNDITYPWSGNYFPSIPISIEAIPRTGYKFSHWTEIADSSSIITIELETNTVLTANFIENDDIDIQEITSISLGNAYPNPFNPTTSIKLYINTGNTAKFDIYNIKGQKVKSFGDYKPGIHTVIWGGKDDNGNSVSTGIYLYRLKSKKDSYLKKCMLMK